MQRRISETPNLSFQDMSEKTPSALSVWKKSWENVFGFACTRVGGRGSSVVMDMVKGSGFHRVGHRVQFLEEVEVLILELGYHHVLAAT